MDSNRGYKKSATNKGCQKAAHLSVRAPACGRQVVENLIHIDNQWVSNVLNLRKLKLYRFQTTPFTSCLLLLQVSL
jgi:hypothetical protein